MTQAKDLTLPDDWDPAAPSEEATEYDGVFSWAGESHAFAIGFGVGMTGEQELMVALVGYALAGGKVKHDLTENPRLRDVVREPAYALGGMVAGAVAHRLILGEPIHDYLMGLLTSLGVL